MFMLPETPDVHPSLCIHVQVPLRVDPCWVDGFIMLGNEEKSTALPTPMAAAEMCNNDLMSTTGLICGPHNQLMTSLHDVV